jgi:Bacterial mobilisation protein (MobC)
LKPLKSDSAVIACRLSGAAIARLNALKAESGLNTRQLFEDVLLRGNTVVIKKTRSKPSKDYLALLSQVHRAGNNLNQIARKFNQAKGTLSESDLKQGLVLLQNIEELMLESIGKNAS